MDYSIQYMFTWFEDIKTYLLLTVYHVEMVGWDCLLWWSYYGPGSYSTPLSSPSPSSLTSSVAPLQTLLGDYTGNDPQIAHFHLLFR